MLLRVKKDQLLKTIDDLLTQMGVQPKDDVEVNVLGNGINLQKATAVHEVTAERSEHDFVLAHKAEKLDIRGLRGLGKEIWKGLDVEEYIRKERESWE